MSEKLCKMIPKQTKAMAKRAYQVWMSSEAKRREKENRYKRMQWIKEKSKHYYVNWMFFCAFTFFYLFCWIRKTVAGTCVYNAMSNKNTVFYELEFLFLFSIPFFFRCSVGHKCFIYFCVCVTSIYFLCEVLIVFFFIVKTTHVHHHMSKGNALFRYSWIFRRPSPVQCIKCKMTRKRSINPYCADKHLIWYWMENAWSKCGHKVFKENKTRLIALFFFLRKKAMKIKTWIECCSLNLNDELTQFTAVWAF